MPDSSDATFDPWKADLDLITEAAQEAADAAMQYFGNAPQTWWKNDGASPVTAADYAANDILIDRLRKARPDYGWLSEENEDDGERLNRETLFVVDPIDGTRAFMNGRKTWCVSVAVVHRGRPVAGVLAAPARDEIFTATLTSPARRNGAVILARPIENGETIEISASGDSLSKLPDDFRARAHRVDHIPSLAYRLAMVADGRIHATLVRPNSHDWDIAAAHLILQRAGGQLLDMKGNTVQYNGVLISHGVMCAAHKNGVRLLFDAASGAFGH